MDHSSTPPTADRRLPTPRRTLAIDLGSRRVGLALSDEGGRYATPFGQLDVTAAEQALAPVLNVIEREGVRRVVVGVPLNMDGSVGPMARASVAWGAGLAQAKVDVVYVDERLSSFDAEQQLIARKRNGEKITRNGRKQRLDAMAAAGFLQEFLDGALPPLDVTGWQR